MYMCKYIYVYDDISLYTIKIMNVCDKIVKEPAGLFSQNGYRKAVEQI